MLKPNSLRSQIRENEQYARDRNANWEYSKTPFSEVKRMLGWKIEREIRQRLKRDEKVVVVDTGCGQEPAALNFLADRFKNEVVEGRVELHGLNLSASAPPITRNAQGVYVHNDSPRTFFRKGIRANLMFDHLGSIFHASDSGSQATVNVYLRGLSRILAPNGEFRFQVRNGFPVQNSALKSETTPKIKIIPTRHTGFFITSSGGSEFGVTTRTHKMIRR